MIYDRPYIRLFVKPLYIDTSALTRRKTLVKMFFASPLISSHVNNSTKDAYFADNNDFNHNTASRPPLLVTIYICFHRSGLSVRRQESGRRLVLFRFLSGNNLQLLLSQFSSSSSSQTPVWDSFSRNRVWDSFPGTPAGIPDSRGSQDPSLGFIPCLGSQIPVDPRLPSGI